MRAFSMGRIIEKIVWIVKGFTSRRPVCYIPTMIRVITGSARGRRLAAPRGTRTRPTSGKVREALFDILGSQVTGTVFLDLFSGTGAVGIEAVSRGAARAVLVERDPEALRAIRANAQLSGLASRIEIQPIDVDRCLKILASRGTPTDIIFCDPPYAYRGWKKLLKRLGGGDIIRPAGLAIIEHDRDNDPGEVFGVFRRIQRRIYGGTHLSVFQRQER